jgi:DNA polymerase-3 subunit epsilon
VEIEIPTAARTGHRITEIGPVKVRNHEVVAEWHSLVNPQRFIPANITRLTGINNADSFLQFRSVTRPPKTTGSPRK